MARAIQKRTLETRARLLAAAEEVIGEVGFEAMRVEEVVLRAGTAKGTFFAHFSDKEALMDLIIGARIDTVLDEMAAAPPPKDIGALVEALMPLCTLMTCERYVFDIILRYSGAAGPWGRGAHLEEGSVSLLVVGCSLTSNTDKEVKDGSRDQTAM